MNFLKGPAVLAGPFLALLPGLVFLLAANLAGASLGLVGLIVFPAGLITMNLLMTASIVGVLGISGHQAPWSASFSLWAAPTCCLHWGLILESQIAPTNFG